MPMPWHILFFFSELKRDVLLYRSFLFTCIALLCSASLFSVHWGVIYKMALLTESYQLSLWIPCIIAVYMASLDDCACISKGSIPLNIPSPTWHFAMLACIFSTFYTKMATCKEVRMIPVVFIPDELGPAIHHTFDLLIRLVFSSCIL